MGHSLHDHIMTIHRSIEGMAGVKGAATIVICEDGRINVVHPEHISPFEIVEAVGRFADAVLEPEDIDEPEELWLLIEEAMGK